MITAVAFCPQAPALVPDIGRGLDAELGPVRDACRTAIRRVAASADEIGILAATVYDGGFGPDTGDETVGGWLVHDVFGTGPSSGETSVLVVTADGTARRTEKAPGYLDERAVGFDDEIAAALRSGDPTELAKLDRELADELLATGVRVWHDLAARLDGSLFTADLLYADAPFGVGYFVATWQLRGVPVA